MRRAWVHYGVDLLLFLTGMVLAVSSLLVWVVLPRGYNAPWLLWIAIHQWSGFALLVESLLHVALHRRWLLAMTRRAFTRSRVPGREARDADAPTPASPCSPRPCGERDPAEA